MIETVCFQTLQNWKSLMIVADFAVDVSTHWLDWNEFLAFMVSNNADKTAAQLPVSHY